MIEKFGFVIVLVYIVFLFALAWSMLTFIGCGAAFACGV